MALKLLDRVRGWVVSEISDIIAACGIILIAAGLWQLSRPAAMVVTGAILLGVVMTPHILALFGWRRP